MGIAQLVHLLLSSSMIARAFETQRCGYGPHLYRFGESSFTVYQLLGRRVNLTVDEEKFDRIGWSIEKGTSGLLYDNITALYGKGIFTRSGVSITLDLVNRTYSGIEVKVQIVRNSNTIYSENNVIINIGEAPTVRHLLIRACDSNLSICANVTGTPIPSVVVRYAGGNSNMTSDDNSASFCSTVSPSPTTNNFTFSVASSNCFGTESVTALVVKNSQNNASSWVTTIYSDVDGAAGSCLIVYRNLSVISARTSLLPSTAPIAAPTPTKLSPPFSGYSMPDVSGDHGISHAPAPFSTGCPQLTVSTTLPATSSSTKAETIPGPTSSSLPDSSPASASTTMSSRSSVTGTSADSMRNTTVSPSPTKITSSITNGNKASIGLCSTICPSTSNVPPQGAASAGLPIFIPVVAAAGAVLLLVLVILIVWMKKRKGTNMKDDRTYENTDTNWLETRFTVKPSEDTGLYDHLSKRSKGDSNIADDPVNTDASCNLSGGYAIPLNAKPQYDVIMSPSVPPNENAEQPSEDVGSGYELLGREETMTSDTPGTLTSLDVTLLYAEIDKSKKSVKEDESSKLELQTSNLIYVEMEAGEKPEASQSPLSDGTVVYAELNPEQPKSRDGLQ